MAIATTVRRPLVPPRRLAGHRREPGAGAAHHRRARPDDGVQRHADGDAPPVGAVRRPAADPAERVLRARRRIDPDRYRANAWLAVVSRLAGVVFFLREPAAYRRAGTLRPGVLRAGGGAAVHRHAARTAPPKSPAADDDRSAGVVRLVADPPPVAGDLAGVVVLGFAGALVTYNRFFREADRPGLRVRRGSLPVRLDRHRRRARACRTGSGSCCRGSSRTCCPAPAATPRWACVSRGDAEMPIGLSKVTVGFPRVGINCALCHTASYRLRPDDPPVLVPGGPSHQTAPQAYFRFLFAAASRSALQRVDASSARSPRTTGCR